MWGKGIATEATRLFISEVKDKFDLKTLGAFTFVNNHASIHVLKKSGFQEMESFIEDGVESKFFQNNL